MTTIPLQVAIVDGQPEAFQELSLARGGSAQFHFFDSGQAALQFTSEAVIQIWLINIHTPDMSGLELFGMLHQRNPTARFVLVGDVYDADEERQARTYGASGYLCKPPQTWWLEPWQREAHTHAGHRQVSKPQTFYQLRKHES